MITIVHILSDSNLSGAPAHVLALACGLNPAKFRSVVICPTGPLNEALKTAKIKSYTVGMASKFDTKTKNQIQRVVADFSEEISDRDQLIIHCHGVRAGLLGRLAIHDLGYPIVYTEHSWTADYRLPNPINNAIQPLMLAYLNRYTTKTIAVSKAVARYLLEAKITTPDKLVTIYNGIDLPGSFIRPNQKPIVGSVGSLSWQKNYRWLISLWPEVLKQVPDAKLEIIGQGYEEQLKKLIYAFGLTKSVALLGSVPAHELSRHYQNWCLYIQPSTNESFGLALAEAVAAGLPALAAKVGSIPEVLGTENGLFGLKDTKKAAAKIIVYLKNETLRRALWQAEYKTVSGFTEAKMITQHEKLYTEIANSS